MPPLPPVDPGQSHRGRLDGPAGTLEYRLEAPSAAPRALAVICHPHPLYGGTMDNKVVYSLARAALACDVVALRFQFRGVGDSDGPHDEGRGEAEDAAHLLAELRAAYPGIPALLMGFSFGAFVALKVAAGDDAVAGLVTIAPPLSYAGDASVPQPGCPWLVIHGDADDVVDCAETHLRLEAMGSPADFEVLSGAGHFFHGRLNDLRQCVESWLTDRLAREQEL